MISTPARIRPSIRPPTPRRRRVLVCAYAVSPDRGSEPGIGWNIASRLAKSHDVTLLCSPGVPGPDANCFRTELANQQNRPGLRIEFVDPPLLSFLFQRESTLCRRTLYYSGYAAWQRRALAIAQRLHAEKPFDLIHQLNITGYREPGYLWKLDAPFVWGPIAGAPNFPRGYFDLLSRQERLFYRLRNWTNEWHKTSIRCRRAAERATHIWAVSDEDVEMARARWNRSAEQMRESGSACREDSSVRDYDGHRPLRIVWSAQHIGRKALPILLHAMAIAKSAVELTVLGEGPENAHWKSLTDSLNLKNVRWTGWLPRERALAEVARCDVLAFTSLLEGTPQALLEAMAMGLPVICHETCGMNSAVNDDCGIRVPVENSQSSIGEFARAIDRLAADPSEVCRLSQGALRQTRELTWDNQVQRMVEIYDRIFSETPIEI